MRNRIAASWVLSLLGCLGGTAGAVGQVVERDTKLTGPRGRTIERSIRTERGPGFVDRQVEIKRPGETLIRDTRIQQPGGYGPRPGFRPGPPGRPVVIERDLIVERAPLIAPFVAPFFNFSFGSPPPPPPPPVVYVPEPIVIPEPVYVAAPGFVATAPVVVGVPAYAPPPPAPVVPPEPPLSPQVADAIGRLASFHHQSRRDGALTLGHLGDPRAVGPLMERVQHDLDREVRVAAAWALGELADPRAAVVLERAALYDKRQEVRDAANTAYRKLPRPVAASSSSAVGSAPGVTSPPAPAIVSRPGAIQPSTGTLMLDPGAPNVAPADTPPPFPSPEPPLDAPR